MNVSARVQIPAIRGWWRITETEVWTTDALDLLGPAMISLTAYGDRIRMIAILAYVQAKPNKGGRWLR